MSKQLQLDKKFMARAIQLARLGVAVAPNPMVGAVITFNNKIIGEGYHKLYGEAHAEVNSIASVKDKGLLSKATLYVTLEPCSHYGKTPPCTALIIQHAIKRVVIACTDTSPNVSGKGIQLLKDAGINVVEGVLYKEAIQLNRRFFTFHEKQRPYIILKWARTKDGFIDRLPDERKQGVNWITEANTKLFVHNWRAKEAAILVGWKTINNDDPQLTVREIKGKNPHRFVLDPHNKINLNSRVLNDGLPTTIFTSELRKSLQKKEVKTIVLDTFSTKEILNQLYKKNITSLLIEGGGTTLQHFINEDFWDEAYCLTGATRFGKGIPSPKLKDAVLNNTLEIGKDRLVHYFHSNSIISRFL